MPINLQTIALAGVSICAALLGAPTAEAITEEDKLVALRNAAGIEFGTSVAIDGEWAVVGAPNETTITAGEGAAYVFRNRFGRWTLEQTLADPEADLFDEYGASVAIDGDTMAVGANGGGPRTIDADAV